jgi:hypothetical protein
LGQQTVERRKNNTFYSSPHWCNLIKGSFSTLPGLPCFCMLSFTF